jgi:inner membrane protease subunit 1
MEPMLSDGQVVWASLLAYKVSEPRTGDIVVFRDPGQPDKVLVKEVVGQSGDDISIGFGHRGSGRSWYLLEGQYFVTGRNIAASRDSRDFGPITSHLLIGKVWR